MWSEEEILQYLQNHLSENRLEHSISVSKTAVDLAQKYGGDVYKAKLSGMVHDCAKFMSDEELLEFIKKHGYDIDTEVAYSPMLLHGLTAAIISKEEMGIEDEDIFNAVAYHTTGRKKMSILEKIIYISDYIEPLRDFPGVEELRKATYQDLEKGILRALDNTIVYVVSKGQLLHKDTLDARNYLLIKNSR